MKLLVWDNVAKQRIYLNLQASTRVELANIIGSPWFTLKGKSFHVNNVVAEPDTNNTGAGAVVGGLIGLLGGPIGVIAGGLLGGAIGNGNDQAEIKRVNYFNNSRYFENYRI